MGLVGSWSASGCQTWGTELAGRATQAPCIATCIERTWVHDGDICSCAGCLSPRNLWTTNGIRDWRREWWCPLAQANSLTDRKLAAPRPSPSVLVVEFNVVLGEIMRLGSRITTIIGLNLVGIAAPVGLLLWCWIRWCPS